MDWSKLKYTKSSKKTREENILEKRPENKINVTDAMLETSATTEYRKSDGELSTSLVFILSGGDKKEKDFFKVLIKNEIRSLRVLFMSKKGQGLLPSQMNEKWHEILKSQRLEINAQEYKLETLDKIFLVSDVDEFRPKLEDISHQKDGLKNWIISNPCFETWLYYCYLNNPETDLNELNDYGTDKRSQHLKKLQNELVKGGFNPIVAFEHIKEGIKHSKLHYSEDMNHIPTLFSTQMHILASYILEIMERNDHEYSKLLRKKEEMRNRYRKK